MNNIWDKKFYGGKDHLDKKFQIPEKGFDEFVGLLKKENAKKVLDLGSGTGRHLIPLVEQGFETYGIDFSENALSVCKDRLREKDLEANIKSADFYKTLPYEDDFFDGMISTSAMHHAVISDIKLLIKEVERVLKNKAIVMIKVPQLVDDFKPDDVKIIEPGTEVHLSGSEEGVPHHRFEKDELKNIFGNFEIIELISKKENKFRRPHLFLLAKLNK